MTTLDAAHKALRKRPIRFGWFNWTVWAMGFVAGLVTLYFTQSLWALVILPTAFLVGIPVRDYGSPHAFLLKRHKARQAWKRDFGVLRRPPLGNIDRKGKPTKNRTKLDDVRLVKAKILEGTRLIDLPLLTTVEGNELTVPLLLSGASPDWVGDDLEGRMSWDQQFVASMKHAFDATRSPIIRYVMGRIQRPSNREPGLLYNMRRGNQTIMEAINRHEREEAAKARQPDEQAAETSQQDASPTEEPLTPEQIEDAVNVTIGGEIHQLFDDIHSIAGDATHYAAITMPWPVKWGKRLDLHDPIAVRRSSLWKTMDKVVAAYRANGIPARLPSVVETEDTWTTALSVAELPQQQFYAQLRGMLTDLIPEEGDGPQDLPVPLSARCYEGGVVRIGQTYFIAGYATALNRQTLPVGFQRHAVRLDNDVYYTFATHVDCKLISGEKHRAREAERGRKMGRGVFGGFWNKGVSDPGFDKAISEDIRYRQELEDAGQRNGVGGFLFNVAATSIAEVVARWEDTITQLGGIYEIQKVVDPDDVFDVILGQLGVKVYRESDEAAQAAA